MATGASSSPGLAHPHLASLTLSRAQRLAQLEEAAPDEIVDTTPVRYPRHPDLQRTTSGIGSDQKTLATSYAFWFPPLGLFGAHHYYLNNTFLAVFCTLTLGGVGVMWLVDLFRMKILVDRENTRRRTGTKLHHLDNAYLLHIPWGILGLHQYYMGNIKTGISYTLTLGFFGCVWFFDLFIMPTWIEESNEDAELEEEVVYGGYTQSASIQSTNHLTGPWSTGDLAPYEIDYSLPPPTYDSVMNSPNLVLMSDETHQTERYYNLGYHLNDNESVSDYSVHQSVFNII